MAIFICILKNQLGLEAGIRKDRKGLVIGLRTSRPFLFSGAMGYTGQTGLTYCHGAGPNLRQG